MSILNIEKNEGLQRLIDGKKMERRHGDRREQQKLINFHEIQRKRNKKQCSHSN